MMRCQGLLSRAVHDLTKAIWIKESNMYKSALGLAFLFTISQAVTFGQSDPTKSATYIMNSDVKAVEDAGAARTPPAVDQMLKIVDLKKYNLGVGIIHRGPTAPPGGRGNATKKGGGAARGPVEHCTAGSGMATASRGGTGVPGGISHDDETETYIIVSGGGTLVTGGTIINGSKSAPESEVTKILNGPSCSGAIVGPDVVQRQVS
ncbi:MAG: hypothetical protein ABSB35_25850, partial [Bryobacteraceae bacterium]